MLLSLLVALAAGSTPVAPISVGNALTLPAQRHLVRVDPGDGGAAIWLLAINQGSVDGHGLGFFRSDDEAATWRYYAPIQPDSTHNDRAHLITVGPDVALVYSWESSTLSGSTRHDVYFQWWRFQPGTREFAPQPKVLLWDSTSSSTGYYRAEIARDSVGRLWVQAWRLESSGAHTAVVAVSEDGGATFTRQPDLASLPGPGRGGGMFIASGGRLLFVFHHHDAGSTPARFRVRDDAAPLATWSPLQTAFADGIYHGAALSAAPAPGGGVHLVYKDLAEGLYYRLFDGTAFGPRTPIYLGGDWAVQPAVTVRGDELIVFFIRNVELNTHYELLARSLRNGVFSDPVLLDGSVSFKGYPAAVEEVPATATGVPCFFGSAPDASSGGQAMLAFLGAAPPPPSPRPGIALGSTWKYDDRGVDLGTAWLSLGYDDDAWPEGPGQLGYGDGDEATRLRQTSPSQPSVYFRKQLDVQGLVTDAHLVAIHDDGIAVWVNGQLAFQKYTGRGLAYSAYASTTSQENERSEAALDPSLFVEGPNQIAVMVKQVSGSSSDLSFDLGLELTLGQAPQKSVRVQFPNGGERLTPGSVSEIRWTSAGDVPLVDLAFSADGGATWTPLASGAPNTGSHAWTVPSQTTASGLVRVADAADPALFDQSDATFSIANAPTTSVVVPFRSVWRYDDRGVDLGSGWMAPAFPDGSWKSGPGQLGYGDRDEATVLIRTKPAAPSYYFRKTITVSGPVSAASLRVLHDDGVAVWVNGALVYSRYVGSTAFSAWATASSKDNQISTATLPASAFVAGDNVIAVMVKQRSGSSSDLSFDLELTLTTGAATAP